jgi:hypothetical protein
MLIICMSAGIHLNFCCIKPSMNTSLSYFRYQSTQQGAFLSTQFLESQFTYQTSIEESVVLIYGKFNIYIFLFFML